MTKEEIKRQNPWREVANMALEVYNDDKDFAIQSDVKAIHDFNNAIRDKYPDCVYNLHLPPMPFSGNILDAKLIILSLNPGYVEYLNKDLVGMLAPEFQDAFVNSAKRHLRMETISIYDCEIERIVGENYWADKLRPLAEAVYGSDKDEQKEIFRQVAILQHIGYFSTKFLDKKVNLEGTSFLRTLLKYLADDTDAKFLIMRARSHWEKLFPDGEYTKLKEDGRIIDEISSPICQAITDNNIKDGKFQAIVNHLKNN